MWCLKRCIYGLNDAPQSWYERVKEVLPSLGATISTYALFLWHNDSGELFGILVSHVDDFAFCGNARFQTEVIEQLKSIFKIGLYANGSFNSFTTMSAVQHACCDALISHECFTIHGTLFSLPIPASAVRRIRTTSVIGPFKSRAVGCWLKIL